MVLKMSTIAIVLLTTFTVLECARIRLDKVEERTKVETQAQIAARSDEEDADKYVVEDKIDKASEDGATIAANGSEADSAGAPGTAAESPAALVQEAVAQGPDLWPFFKWERLGSLLGKVGKQLGVVHNETPSTFSKTLEYIKTAQVYYSRFTILEMACDSSAFSCKEIVQLANNCWPEGPWAELWLDAVMVFAAGRNKTGCISDPANAKLIVHEFKSKWPDRPRALGELKQIFIFNSSLKPAEGVGPPPMQLQTGFRTDSDMEKLLLDMEEMQLIKAYGSQGHGRLYEPGSASVEEFESWLKQIRANGEQFSGPQLVTLVNAIPENRGTAQAVSALLQYLEQYVTGVTCEEVKQIIQRIGISGGRHSWFAGLEALKSNIIDGQNKVDIVAFTDLITSRAPQNYHSFQAIARRTVEVLRDVGVGLPPKNNPVFGVVQGNPVILVVDESTSMDTKFTLGDDTFTRRQFCYSELETVLEGLPDGTYFNVIQYSSSAVKIFQTAVPVSKTNIHAAMEAMGAAWSGDHAQGEDPAEMIRNIKVFALNFTHLKRSTKRNSMEALRLAYATIDLPSSQTDGGQRPLRAHGATRDSPQIYFLTSGQPDGGARQILDNIGEFDNGRNIPVNSIAFIVPANRVAKQFVKDLATKTGGFFRSIEQASLYTNVREQEPTEG